jgi:hypothetical protein
MRSAPPRKTGMTGVASTGSSVGCLQNVHWTPIYQSVDGRGCVNKRWDFVEAKLADVPVGIKSSNDEIDPFSIPNQSVLPSLDM